VSYYDDASLVLIPSGVKTSKVYSQKPTNGTGDLTFSRASTATRTNASGVIESVASNVPRLDYSGGATCPRLLLEPQRTNLALRSEEFDNAYWTKRGSTITANATTSPDGTIDADELKDNTSSSLHDVYFTPTGYAANSFFTLSAFVKPNTLSACRLIATQTGGVNVAFASFNLSTQATTASVLGNFTNATSKIESLPNGWYRVILTFQTGAGGTLSWDPVGGCAIRLEKPYQTQIYTGTFEGLYVWGAQLETGSFASSYIPTTTAAVTRIVDIAEKFGVGSLIGSPAGTIFLQVQILSLGYSRSFISLQDTSFATNSIRIECTAANRWRIQIRNGSTTILDQTVTTGSAFTTGNYKLAYAYDTNTNGVAFYVNGVSLFTTTVASIPTACVNLFLGTRLAGIYDLNVSDSFDQALLFKTRLTNAQLAELTTL
jgi:hypothetical protein